MSRFPMSQFYKKYGIVIDIIGSGITDYILHNVNDSAPSKIGVF